MGIKETLRQYEGKYWLITGLASYAGAAISSIVRSLGPTLGDNLYAAVDWFTACIIYFFLGAIVGYAIDYALARKKPKNHPLWLYLIVSLWVVGSIVVGITSREGLLSPVLIAIFPLAFGIFFTGSAFVLLAPQLVKTTLYGKLVLDIIYLAIFSAWLYLVIRAPHRTTTIRILLGIVFFVLFLGLAGCVQVLS